MDDAQKSYPDTVLWNTWLKELPEHFIFVLFASHGSQSTPEESDLDEDGVGNGTPNALLPHMQMLLRPTENGFTFMGGTHIPGLYFTRAELQELVKKLCCKHLPTLVEELSEWVYRTSAGHIGAIESIFLCITVCVFTNFFPPIIYTFQKHRHGGSLTYNEF